MKQWLTGNVRVPLVAALAAALLLGACAGNRDNVDALVSAAVNIIFGSPSNSPK